MPVSDIFNINNNKTQDKAMGEFTKLLLPDDIAKLVKSKQWDEAFKKAGGNRQVLYNILAYFITKNLNLLKEKLTEDYYPFLLDELTSLGANNNPFVFFLNTTNAKNIDINVENYRAIHQLFTNGVIDEDDLRDTNGILYNKTLYKSDASNLDYLVKASVWLLSSKNLLRLLVTYDEYGTISEDDREKLLKITGDINEYKYLDLYSEENIKRNPTLIRNLLMTTKDSILANLKSGRHLKKDIAELERIKLSASKPQVQQKIEKGRLLSKEEISDKIRDRYDALKLNQLSDNEAMGLISLLNLNKNLGLKK